MSPGKSVYVRASMIGVDARPSPPVFTRPVSYPRTSPIGSAATRCGTTWPITSKPPAFSFSETNCSGVIAPLWTAVSPYWRPMLSSGRQAKPFAGLRPSCVAICSKLVHLIPPGFVTGLYLADDGHSGGAGLERVRAAGEGEVPEQARVEGAEARGRGALRVRPAGRDTGRAGEVQRQQPAIGHGSERDRVLERRTRDDPVEDARVVVPDQVLLDRAARAAEADRVPRLPVRLGEVLLHHQRDLGRDHLAAVVVVDVQGRRRDGIATGEEEVGEHAAVPLALVVADVAAAAERVDEPFVPAGLVRERARRRGGIVEGGDLVDAAVDHSLLDPNDVVDGAAVERRRAGEVGRFHRRVGERREGAGGRPVLVANLRRCGAVGVERRPEAVLHGLAEERLLLRAGEHRPAEGVVHDSEGRGAARRRSLPVAVGARDDLVLAQGEPVDEPAQRAVGHRPEAPGHIPAVRLDAEMLQACGVVVEADLDEDVAARDVLRQRRQRLDGGRRAARASRAGGQQAGGEDGCGRCDETHHARA